NKTLATDAATGTANLTVVNQVGSKLPVTGSTMTIIGLAAGCGLMVTALVMNRKAKKGKE
ncbi:LPXTG cell wall anchor domain-containing protein, partial [Faecalibaculum rodentium]